MIINNLPQKEKLDKVKKAFEKGLIVIPSRVNRDGIYKIPIWNGNVKTQVWNFERFKETIKTYKNWGFGVLTGKQPNGLYLNCLDFDIDIIKKGAPDYIKELSKFFLNTGIPEALQGLEQTQTDRFHFFFFTEEELIKPKDVAKEGWIKFKELEENGTSEIIEEPGKIELFTGNKFVACYEGIVKDTNKEPIPLRDLPVLDIDTVKRLLKTLGFEFEYLTQDERILKEVKEEQEKERKKEKKENPKLLEIKEKIKKEINIEDLLYEYSDTFKVINPNNPTRLDCLCPFKPERHPSFKIFKTDNRQFWADFHGKHEGFVYPEYLKTVYIGEAEALTGDVIDIYRIYTGVDFKQALIDLGERIGINKEEIEKAFKGKKEEEIKIPDNLFKSYDSKNFYKVDYDRKEVYIGKKEDANLWITEETGITKGRLKQLILAQLPKVELRFLPNEEFGYNKEKGFINTFSKSDFMRLYETTKKEIKDLQEISYEDIENNILREYIKNLFYTDDEFRAFISFLVLKLAGQKAGYILLFQTNQGAGKSNILTPLLKVLFGEKYIAELDYSSLRRDFNPMFENKYIIVLEEMHIKDRGEDKHIYEQLKRSTRAKKITINKKNINEYEIDFYADFIGYSNKNIPIVISDTDDTRIILIQNFASKDLKTIFRAYDLILEEFYEIVEKEFIKLVKDIVLKIPVREARKFLENYIDYQNNTVKKELLKATDKLYLLIDEFREIEEHITNEPRTQEEIKAILHVKSGLATTKDIMTVLKLMGDDYYAKSSKALGMSLRKYEIEEIRTMKRRLKVINKEMSLSSATADDIYELIDNGYLGHLYDKYKILLDNPFNKIEEPY